MREGGAKAAAVEAAEEEGLGQVAVRGAAGQAGQQEGEREEGIRPNGSRSLIVLRVQESAQRARVRVVPVGGDSRKRTLGIFGGQSSSCERGNQVGIRLCSSRRQWSARVWFGSHVFLR